MSQFLCPRIERSGAYCFCLVCLSVVNFNLRYNFRTVRDKDFIFGMHTPLMMPFQMTPRSMTLCLDVDLEAKNSFFRLCCRRGHTVVFHKHPLIFVDDFIIPPATKLGGYTGITMSVRLSVRPSVCPAAFGFPAHNCFPFTPIIMKLHMQTPH